MTGAAATRRVLALAAGLSLVAAATLAPPSSADGESLNNFVNLMTKGTRSAYIATYRVKHFVYFSPGTITVANLPRLPGAKPTPNVDGYSSTLRSAYVFRGNDGHLVQWIHDDANVSACTNVPSPSGYKDLQCSRPSPYVQSNGYGEEEVGFVPAFVLQTVKTFDSTYLAKPSSIFFRVSPRFGPLRCILQKQVKGPMQQTTCVNRAGVLVSWSSRNGQNNAGQAKLTTLSHHPTARNLATMRRPTMSIILPPF